MIKYIMQSSLLPSRCGHRLRQSDDVSCQRFPDSSSHTQRTAWLQRAPRLSVSIPTGREHVQGCSMASSDTRAGLLLVGCLQDQFLQAWNLCNCRMAVTRGEGGQRHLKILEFLTQGHLKRLGICQCWMSCFRTVTCGQQEGDGVRGFTGKRGVLRYRPF